MGAVVHEAGHSVEAAWQADVLQGGERPTYDLLHRLDQWVVTTAHPLEPLTLCLSAVGKPRCDAVRQDTLDGGAEKVTSAALPS